MKPQVKNDSWCYTASARKAREKIRRLSNKRHRQDTKKTIDKLRGEADYRFPPALSVLWLLILPRASLLGLWTYSR